MMQKNGFRPLRHISTQVIPVTWVFCCGGWLFAHRTPALWAEHQRLCAPLGA